MWNLGTYLIQLMNICNTYITFSHIHFSLGKKRVEKKNLCSLSIICFDLLYQLSMVYISKQRQRLEGPNRIHDKKWVGIVYGLVIYKLFKLTMTTFWRFNHLILKANDDNVWCYVYYYVWLNVVINKVVILSSKIMVTWIFGYYHITHKMHSICHALNPTIKMGT